MIGYLNITGLNLALLLNFKHATISWKRIVGPKAEAPGSSGPACLSLPIRGIRVIRG
jgi:hypothetical protein